MADERKLKDSDLEDLFSAARAQAPHPDPGLVARIVADAEAEADRREAEAAARPDGRRRPAGPRAILAAIFGGWPSLAGLSAAALAGLLVGYVAPDTADTVSGGLLGGEDTAYGIEDLADPGLDFADLWAEG